MKNRKIMSLASAVVLCSILASSCDVTLPNQSSAVGAVTEEAQTNSSTSQSAAALDYVNQMDKSKILSVEISADASAWQSMLDNAINEEYISADITINGTTIKNVGIRPKGNSSLNSIARDEDSNRYSFKVKFDEYVQGQTWLGLDTLVLNNNYSDASSMKEYLSYDIMSFIGVDSPLYSYADIQVNNESWGFYLAVEEVDSAYLDRTKNGEGELYKPESMDMQGGMPDRTNNLTAGDTATVSPTESAAGTTEATEIAATKTTQSTAATVTPTPTTEEAGVQSPKAVGDRGQGGFGGMGASGGVSLLYTDDNESSYSAIFDNAETKTDTADHQQVIEALKNLNSGTDLEKYVDVDEVLRYLAAHTVVVNLDSYSGNMGHNYYLYENNGQLSILPWDYNMAFGGFQSGDASAVVNFPIDTPVSGVSMEDRPMIAKLLEVPEYLETYHKYLQEIIDGYFANGKFEQTVNGLNDLISTSIKNDPTAFSTYEEYQAAVTELIKLGTLRAESIEGQLNGTIPSTSQGQEAAPETLIDASSVNMSALGSMGGGMGGDMGGRAPGGAGMPGLPEGVSMETMQKAMDILRAAQDGQLTEEQRTQLHELGLTDEQIEELLALPMAGPGGGNFGDRGATE